MKSYRREGDVQELSLRPSGTTSERLQKWGIANRGAALRIHLCSQLCGGEKVEDDYFHAHRAMKVGPGQEEPWMRSLEIAADEVPDLRLAVEGHTPGGKDKGGEAPGEPPGEEDKKEKKGKKKKKKKEEKERSQRDLKEKKKKKQDEDLKSRKGSTSSTSSSSVSSQKRNPGKKTLPVGSEVQVTQATRVHMALQGVKPNELHSHVFFTYAHSISCVQHSETFMFTWKRLMVDGWDFKVNP